MITACKNCKFHVKNPILEHLHTCTATQRFDPIEGVYVTKYVPCHEINIRGNCRFYREIERSA